MTDKINRTEGRVTVQGHATNPILIWTNEETRKLSERIAEALREYWKTHGL